MSPPSPVAYMDMVDMDVKYYLHMSPIPVSHVHVVDLPYVGSKVLKCVPISEQLLEHLIVLRNFYLSAFYVLLFTRSKRREGSAVNWRSQMELHLSLTFMKILLQRCGTERIRRDAPSCIFNAIHMSYI